MDLVIRVAALVAYFMVGLVYARRAYAREQYELGKLTSCKQDCGSRVWRTTAAMKSHCTCGFLKQGEAGVFIVGALIWPLFMPLEFAHSFITGGTYEPKEEKLERRKRELQADIKRLENELKKPMYMPEDL